MVITLLILLHQPSIPDAFVTFFLRKVMLSDRLRDDAHRTGAAGAALGGVGGGVAPETDVDGAEDGLADLLACLGLEEQKVVRLRAKLEELGVDADVLLEGLGQDDDAEPGIDVAQEADLT